MALFANANRGRGTPQFTGSDFFQLSYDTRITEAPKLDSKNFMEDMRKRFTPKK